MFRFCRMRPDCWSPSSYNLDGGGAMRPLTVTVPGGVSSAGRLLRSKKLRCTQPRCTSTTAGLSVSANGVTTKRPGLAFICRLSRNTVLSVNQRPFRSTWRYRTSGRCECAASSRPDSGGWLDRLAIAAARASFSAARDNCHLPSPMVSAMASAAASVNSQNRRTLFTG